MGKNVTQQLIESHLVEGRMKSGEEVGLKIDQTLTQDATGTLVMLEFEALGIPRIRTTPSKAFTISPWAALGKTRGWRPVQPTTTWKHWPVSAREWN